MLLSQLIKTYGKLKAKKKIRQTSRQKYMNSDKPKYCVVCGYSKHIEIHHIVPICKFSGDALVDDIVSLDNLEAMCPNCHAMVHKTECD